MDFSFNSDQLLFQDNVRSFFINEVTPERIRELWQSDSGRCDRLWGQLVELGLTALTVPEQYGGMGLGALDFVLLAQECGYAGLPEPLVETMLVAVPLLAELGAAHEGLKADWLGRVAEGQARLAVSEPGNPLVSDAHVADLLLLSHADELHAVPREDAELVRNLSVDPSRQLYQVLWTPGAATCVARGEEAARLLARAFERGALGCAAQLLGLAKRMVDLAVDYSFERKQFGKPIGSFQAVKHLMANVAVRIEFAKGPLYRAAHAVAHGEAGQALAVSHARLAASEAALLAARNAIQTHGAMGYTWEVDLQLFMKRAWALDKAWGDHALHKARIRQALFDSRRAIGAGTTFMSAEVEDA
ncbi:MULTISPECIES: acyl-CoA dehydrogenase family protein [Pseudomonas]|uniref:acyl-CoA dehydrogenase family protein n=1 Tax=Pseudomonas TaxID=286 RepID=UPI0015DCD9CD|nr:MULTISPECIES: acyl-CoA dehydrogenase family protein [Pseudomonas]URD44622.1 acyl-CoA/acyl-ACP dehydrogenase [Pseudomonas sp. BYT-5]URK99943.1 acyl-CoA/acyl-ACP dehydrogenase [Pseudomonas sp. BYT-1]BBR54556.1 acyl-CoA dehydrogenase [Pseudomonas putida]